MAVNYTHRGRVDGAPGASVAVSGPIPVTAGDILAVTVVTDSYSGTLASLFVYTAGPDWGFNHRVDYDAQFGGYVGIFALAPVPANASPVIHVEVSGAAAGHRRPSFDIWSITGADPAGPVIQTGTAWINGRSGHLVFSSAAGSRGNTLALIAGVDVLHNSPPYVYGDGVTPGHGFAQSGAYGPPGVSGFGTAVRWATPGGTYYTGVNLGTGYAYDPALFAAMMEFNPAPVPPTVDAGVDRTVERTAGVIRTAGEPNDGGASITARQWRVMSGPGGTTVTTPDQIDSLVHWWRADAITGLTDGANIAAWPDSSGSGYHLEQPLSYYPIYKTGVVNGRPVARFVGSGGLTNLRNETASASLPATTIFAVVRPTDASGARTIRGASDNGGLQFRLENGKIDLVRQGMAVIGTGATTLSTSGFSIVAASYVNATSWAVYLNGTLDGSGSHSQTLTAGRTTYVGDSSLFGGERWAGDIAEVVVFDEVLSSTDRAAVTAYLNTKYIASGPVYPADLVPYGGDPKKCLLPRDVVGAHVIRYTATNAAGPGYDEATITVTPLRPAVDAGPDAVQAMGVITRTASELANDAAITSRQWTVAEGPTSVGTVIGSAAALSWTPPSLGRWVLRYTATSSAGTSDPDTCVITVGVTGVPLQLARTPAPRLAVAIAFGGNLADPDGSEWAFTEVTTDVRVAAGVHVRHGRSDEAGAAQPASCRFTLDNRDGRYSLGGRSPYWPNIRQGTPIQVSVNLGSGFQTIFTGYADGFTPQWSGVPLAGAQRGDATVTVSASGVLRRLAQGNPPQISPMRRALTTAAGVVAYWPCEDEEGSTQIASAFPGHPPMDFSGRLHGGSNPGLPAATPRMGQSQVFDCSEPLPLVSDSEWYGNVPDYTATSVILLRFLIDVPAAGSNDSAVLIGLITTGNPLFWELRYKSGGVVNVRAWRHWTSLVLDQDVSFNLNGRRGQFGLSLTQNGGAVDYQLDFLEVGATAAGIYNGSMSSSTLGRATRVQTATDGGHFDLTLGHIVVRNVARSPAENIKHLNAWRGENVGERLTRLIAENQLAWTAFDGPILNVAVTDIMGPQPPGTLLELLRTCEVCDQGLLFDGINPGASYTTKRYRESRPAALTLDATAFEVGLPFAPVHDDAYRVNRAVASRRKGSNAVYADTTGPLGSDTVGRYDDSLTVDVITDAALIQYAAWMVHQGTCEGYRYPQLALNLTAAPHLLDEWLTIIPGDRVDVTNVASVTVAAPGEAVSLAVEGYEQTITQSTWHVIMNTSLYRRWAVAQVCDETGDAREFGARVDTNGTVIATLTAAGQTVLTVDVTAGPAWTTRADDYPLTLDVGAVPVRATACTAPTGVRQTFTIDPMPVTRPAGTRVQLWNPPVFGL